MTDNGPMTSGEWEVTEGDAPSWTYQGSLPGKSYEELLVEAMTLAHERDELRAHIERWEGVQVQGQAYAHLKLKWTAACLSCRMPWPCPTEVAKGWRE